VLRKEKWERKWKECQRDKERTRTAKETKRKEITNSHNKQFSGKNEGMLKN
jgi:hypothetical protein